MFSYWRIRDDSSQSVTAKLGALKSFEPTKRRILVLPAKWDVRVDAQYLEQRLSSATAPRSFIIRRQFEAMIKSHAKYSRGSRGATAAWEGHNQSEQ